jgi:hypothetical protein
MLKALLFKECRENLWLGGIALAFLLFELAMQTRRDDGSAVSQLEIGISFSRASDEIPFVQDSFSSSVLGVAALLAIALGFRQTLGESLRGTYLLLFHLPVPRWRLVRGKLLVGLCIYSAGTAVPVLLFAFWAATPGTHASPFYWSMTLPTWQALISVTLLYLAAFLCGLRPSRWFGSRLLPLVAVGLAAWILSATPVPWRLALPVTLAVGTVLLACIGHVVRARDYD